MADYRDPAIRLHNIVSQVHRINNKTPIRDGWAQILGLEGVSDAELLRRLGKLISLPAQIRDEFDRQGIPQSPTLDSLPKIEKALGILNLDQPAWQQVKANVTQDALQGLVIASHRELSRDLPRQDVPDSSLEMLTDKVRETIDEALAIDTDARLKRFVVDHLRLVEQAIQDYRIDGGEALERITRCAVGEVVLDPDIRVAHMRHEPILRRFWRTIDRVATVLTVTTTLLGVPAGPAQAPTVVIEGDAYTDFGDDITIEVVEDPVLDAILKLAERPALESNSGADEGLEESSDFGASEGDAASDDPRREITPDDEDSK